MSQATFDSDDLFGEAASEIRGDVEDHLDSARGSLPAPEAIWEVEAENTLGVLNGLSQALDVGGAEDHLRDAKKWYTMGERADAFDDAEDLREEIESIEGIIEDVDVAHGKVSDLTSTIPGLRSALDEAQSAADGSDDANGADAEDDGDEEAEGDEE
jgi:hypothetical protein